MKPVVLLLLLCVFTCDHAVAQGSFVQFIITGLENEEQCRIVEELVTTHPGTSNARAESYSGNFLVFLSQGTVYNEADFRGWLLSAGLDFYCFRMGIVGSDRIVRLTPALCEQMQHRRDP